MRKSWPCIKGHISENIMVKSGACALHRTTETLTVWITLEHTVYSLGYKTLCLWWQSIYTSIVNTHWQSTDNTQIFELTMCSWRVALNKGRERERERSSQLNQMASWCFWLGKKEPSFFSSNRVATESHEIKTPWQMRCQAWWIFWRLCSALCIPTA